MRFAMLAVATAAAHIEQPKSVTPVQTALCTFSPFAFLNSLDSTMEAPAARSHVTPLQVAQTGSFLWSEATSTPPLLLFKHQRALRRLVIF